MAAHVELPADATPATNKILTRGNRIWQGWKTPTDPPRYFETFHYPGALNFQQVV